MTPAREMVVGLGGVAVGAGLALVAGVSAARGPALAAMAGAVAVAAARGLARRVIAALLVLIGVGIAWATLTADATTGSPTDDGAGRPATIVAGSVSALLVGAGGALAVVRGGRWPAMGARFDAPDGRRSGRPRSDDPWAALDRGEDPTLDPDATGDDVPDRSGG